MTDTSAAQFSDLATRGDPPFDRLLLALAAEFHGVDEDAALDELDELARPLFGIGGQGPHAAGERIAAELGRRLKPDVAGVDDLFLDRVLREHRGHPALLAVVYVEVARRAGASLSLLSSQDAWFAGLVAEEEAVLVDPARTASALEGSFTLRRHCAHEVAHAVLCELARRYRALGAADHAKRAAELCLALPLK